MPNFKTCLLAALLLAAPARAGSLTILHINDHHSHLQAGEMDIVIGGAPTRVRAGGMPAVAAVFKNLSASRQNVLKLHAGDAITGDLYYTLFGGEADAALMNAICFDAFALGNHEFDDGDDGLARFLDYLNTGDCQTAVLAANVLPAPDSPLAANNARGMPYLQPYLIKDMGGTRIGIIGIDIATKTKNSSNPNPATQFLDETTTAQKYIDELTAAGIDRIILLTHYQYKNDLALARNLRGVDIIIGGDSHTLLGNEADLAALGLSTGGDYPTRVKNADGELVCIAHAWQYAQIVGELSVQFDDAGVVTQCNGKPHLPLANSFLRRPHADAAREELQGDERAAVVAAITAHPNLSIVEADKTAAAILTQFASEVETLEKSVIGRAAEDLCLSRLPNDKRSTLPTCRKTPHGADITQVVTHAFRAQSHTSDIAIQNAGAVRIDIPAGDITIGDIYRLLPFGNTLVELQMSGAQIRSVLEDALDYAQSEHGSGGAYPYAAGLRWNINASAPYGKRFSNLQYKGRNDNEWTAFDEAKTYRVIANVFIASGRDNYLAFGEASERGDATNTYLSSAQVFIDHIKTNTPLHKPAASNYATQHYTP